MEAKSKNYLIGTALGILLAYGIYRLYLKEDKNTQNKKPVTDENIDLAVSAYKDAVSENATQQILSDLNKLNVQEFGVKVYQRKDGRFSVTDPAGKEIKVVT